MSADGCWRCGSTLHHRRDCKEEIDKDSANLNKQAAYKAHRFLLPKKEPELLKWKNKCEAKQAELVPISILQHFVGIELDFLQEMKYSYQDIGVPTSLQYVNQLRSANQLMVELKTRFPQMREVVAHSKNYFRGNYALTDEDYIFKSKLQTLDDSRQPLYGKLNKLIADLLELSKEIPRMMSFLTAVAAEQEVIASLLRERSPSSHKISEILPALKKMDIHAFKAESTLSKLRSFAEINDINFKFNQVKRTNVELWSLRERKIQEAICQLEIQIECSVCLERPKDRALKCGHQFCSHCIDKILKDTNRQPPLCPQCKRRMEVALTLF